MQEQKKKNQRKGASGSSKSAKPVDRKEQDDFEKKVAVSYTHLTLPTIA